MEIQTDRQSWRNGQEKPLTRSHLNRNRYEMRTRSVEIYRKSILRGRNSKCKYSKFRNNADTLKQSENASECEVRKVESDQI